MKKYLLVAALLLANPAHAQNTLPNNEKPIIEQERLDEVNEQIIEIYAKAKGWCDLPRVTPKPGKPVVQWSYDKNGKCKLQTVEASK
jgi:hypothetical protein